MRAVLVGLRLDGRGWSQAVATEVEGSGTPYLVVHKHTYGAKDLLSRAFGMWIEEFVDPPGMAGRL